MWQPRQPKRQESIFTRARDNFSIAWVLIGISGITLLAGFAAGIAMLLSSV